MLNIGVIVVHYYSARQYCLICLLSFDMVLIHPPMILKSIKHMDQDLILLDQLLYDLWIIIRVPIYMVADPFFFSPLFDLFLFCNAPWRCIYIFSLVQRESKKHYLEFFLFFFKFFIFNILSEIRVFLPTFVLFL